MTLLVNLWKERGDGGGTLHWDTTPFIWTRERGFAGLPVPPGYTSVIGEAIDRHDTVLLLAQRGSGREAEEKNFLVRCGKLVELPEPRGARATEYHGLSDRGWLIGRARLGDDRDSFWGFIAQPLR